MSTVNPEEAKTNLSRLVERAAAWEISIKAALGRLTVPPDRFEEMAVRMGFEIPPILPAHAIAGGGSCPCRTPIRSTACSRAGAGGGVGAGQR
jgi:PIN domain nuclease of toxin-antitoxin system